MKVMRKNYDAPSKAKVALEAIKGERTLAEIASDYKSIRIRLRSGKNLVLTELPNLFSLKRVKENQEAKELQEELCRQLGQLTVELDYL